MGHNIIRANKEHRVLALKDFQHQDIEDVMKRPAFCPKKHHENEELKFFCKDCKVPICNTCVVTLHEGHAKAPLAEAANQRKLRVKSVLNLINKKRFRREVNSLNFKMTELKFKHRSVA